MDIRESENGATRRIADRAASTDRLRGEIDILAIDADGNLVIIELKRDRTPRDVTAQIIDYASWVVTLTPRRIHEITLDKIGRRLDELFRERFGIAPPDVLNASHRMVIVASEFDASSKRIVEYLAEHHGLDINAAFSACSNIRANSSSQRNG